MNGRKSNVIQIVEDYLILLEKANHNKSNYIELF